MLSSLSRHYLSTSIHCYFAVSLSLSSYFVVSLTLSCYLSSVLCLRLFVSAIRSSIFISWSLCFLSLIKPAPRALCSLFPFAFQINVKPESGGRSWTSCWLLLSYYYYYFTSTFILPTTTSYYNVWCVSDKLFPFCLPLLIPLLRVWKICVAIFKSSPCGIGYFFML